MSRSPTSSPRSAVPPSSFRSGPHPSGPRDDRSRNRVETNTRRTSRADMSFEQALQTDGTVVIKEGIDVDNLGQDLTPPVSALSSSPSSRPYSMVHSTANTPVLARPTFKMSPTSPASRPPASASTSASSSSNDLFYDAEDPDYQARRRSMYRSQGTASSPDLATLVRKAKQRGSILPSQIAGKDRRHDNAPPLPSGPHAASKLSPRPRDTSSTSSLGYPAPPVLSSPPMPKGKLQKSWQFAGPSSGSDWVLANSIHDDESIKVRFWRRLDVRGS